MLQVCAEHAEKPKAQADDEAEESTPADPAAAAATAAPAAATTSQTAAEGADGYTAVPTQDENMDQDNAEGSTSNAEADAERKAKEMRKQSIATIGIALIAMGEEVGAEMALRQFQHLVSTLHAVTSHHVENEADISDDIRRTSNP